MSHLHLPDGVLPAWLWVPGLVLTLLLLVLGSRQVPARRLPFQAALGALMLAGMALPLGPLDYHLTLMGPVGILLGVAGSFQVCFVAGVILALMGHGGLTAAGLNVLVMGAGAATARLVYRNLEGRTSAPRAVAAATAIGQLVASASWLLIVAMVLGGLPETVAHRDDGHAAPALLGGWKAFATVAIPLGLLGLAVETAVAYGMARYLERVLPGLLPRAGTGTIAP